MRSLLFIFITIFFINTFETLAQIDTEKTIKSEGFVFNAFLGFNRSVSGEIDHPYGGSRFNREVNDNSGRFVIDTYFLANYFIIPQHLSIGLGTGISKSYKPNFVHIPIIIDLRGYIFQLENNDALYLFLQYGPSPKLGDNLPRGGSFNIGIGYLFKLREHFVSFELGNKARGVSFTDESLRYSDNQAVVRGYYIALGYYF